MAARENVNQAGHKQDAAKAFNDGLSTALDVIDAELFLAGIKTQRAVAVYNYVVTLANFYAISVEPESFLLHQKTEGIEVR